MNTQLRSAYLNDAQIDEMARAAFNSYEMTGEWLSAMRAAQEHAIDEFRIRPNATAVALAVKLAKTKWLAASQAVAREVAK
jgi:hypothetical protein